MDNIRPFLPRSRHADILHAEGQLQAVMQIRSYLKEIEKADDMVRAMNTVLKIVETTARMQKAGV